jgi:hypothetical protein
VAATEACSPPDASTTDQLASAEVLPDPAHPCAVVHKTKIIENCINLMGVSYHLYLAVQGMIILMAIVFANLSNRRA